MRYLMESPLEQLDVCFKFFHTLNANYSISCQQVWNFLQRYVYNIHTAYDINSPSQETVAANLCAANPALM